MRPRSTTSPEIGLPGSAKPQLGLADEKAERELGVPGESRIGIAEKEFPPGGRLLVRSREPFAQTQVYAESPRRDRGG